VEQEPELKRRKLTHGEDEPRSEFKGKNSLPQGLKDTMSKEAEMKYHAMVTSIFGRK